jgi:hypothetical protein
MPTKRHRLTRNLIGDVSPNLLYVVAHGTAPPHDQKLADGHWFDSFQLWGRCAAERRALWTRVGAAYLEQWITEHPGTRPYRGGASTPRAGRTRS